MKYLLSVEINKVYVVYVTDYIKLLSRCYCRMFLNEGTVDDDEDDWVWVGEADGNDNDDDMR